MEEYEANEPVNDQPVTFQHAELAIGWTCIAC